MEKENGGRGRDNGENGVEERGLGVLFFFFKQKTAYEIVSRDWSSDVCSSDLSKIFLSRMLNSIISLNPIEPLHLSKGLSLVRARDRKSVV